MISRFVFGRFAQLLPQRRKGPLSAEPGDSWLTISWVIP